MIRGRRAVLRTVLVALVLLIGAGVAGAYAAGVRCFVVESPSMGRAAPVGSLVVGQRPAPGGVRVGDVVTYRAPDGRGTLYTHRVVERDGSGVRTRGDINAADDPWTVTPSMIVTRAALLLPGAGWLLRALPILVPAAAAVLLATAPIRRASTRGAWRMLGMSAAIALTAFLLRPFTGFVLLESVAATGGMRTTVVSTGLLPIDVVAGDGRALALSSGEVGRLLLHPDAQGLVALRSVLSLDPLGWCLLALVCLLPTLWLLVVGIPEEEEADATA